MTRLPITALCSAVVRRLAMALAAVTLLGFPGIVPVACPPALAQEAGADWYGEMEAGDRQFRFAIESAEEQGKTVHRLRSFDEGDRRFPLERFSDGGGKLIFEIKATGAVYVATVDAGGVAIGTWTQRGQSLPLTFRKAAGQAVPPPADEIWAGTLDAVIQKLPLRFRIGKGAEGKADVRMDSLGQKAGGFRAERVVAGDAWTIKVPAVKGEFAGKLGPDGKLTGSWKQGGANLPLVLEKVAAGAAAALPPEKRRPQTPKPPFPYDVREAAFRNTLDGVDLAGTLTLPQGAGPWPAVVLVSGSGQQDRDETLMDHKPFLVLADALSRAGIAVLRYDDRGVGGSGGDPTKATSVDFARDAEAAIDWLKERPDIDPARIGVVGHSEGGLIAALLAARRTDLAGIVMLAGTGVDGGQILVSQGELVLKSEGLGGADQIRRSRIMQEAMIDAVRGSDDASDPAALAAQAGTRIRADLGDEMETADDAAKAQLDAAIADGLRRLTAPWFRFFIGHDPATALAKVSCPVLAIIGEKDVQVDPTLNLPAIRQALAAGGNTDATVEELPGLNHLFQTCTTGAVSEYDRIEETLAPLAIDTVRDWLVKRLGAK
ncbi:MAG: alpha/beta fold hydrolase [Planctomycetota bacterium]|nr:MAG: alpha/beta fold hydrolase [Planctomycetota bacterium]